MRTLRLRCAAGKIGLEIDKVRDLKVVNNTVVNGDSGYWGNPRTGVHDVGVHQRSNSRRFLHPEEGVADHEKRVSGTDGSKEAVKSLFATRGVVLVPSDLSLADWPERAKEAGLTTIALHADGAFGG